MVVEGIKTQLDLRLKMIIKTNWEEYLKKVLPDNATTSEFMEARRAFYAGSGTMLVFLMEISEHMSQTEAANAINEAIHESEEFIGEVKNGDA